MPGDAKILKGAMQEKNQNNVPGHQHHDASTTTSVRLGLVQNVLINKREYFCSCIACLNQNMDPNLSILWR